MKDCRVGDNPRAGSCPRLLVVICINLKLIDNNWINFYNNPRAGSCPRLLVIICINLKIINNDCINFYNNPRAGSCPRLLFGSNKNISMADQSDLIHICLLSSNCLYLSSSTLLCNISISACLVCSYCLYLSRSRLPSRAAELPAWTNSLGWALLHSTFERRSWERKPRILDVVRILVLIQASSYNQSLIRSLSAPSYFWLCGSGCRKHDPQNPPKTRAWFLICWFLTRIGIHSLDANEADLTLHVLDPTPPGPFWKRNCPVRPTVQNLFKTCSKVTNPKPLCRLVCWSISITASSTLPLFQQTLKFFANDVNQILWRWSEWDTHQIDENIRELHLWRSPD